MVQRWVLAMRPKTLFAAISPVLLGTGLAFACGGGNWGIASVALLGAGFIQVGTNLANDYWDAKKGADQEDRLGPMRVTASGLLPAKQVFWAMGIAFFLAVIAGGFLVYRAGWPVVVIGLVSIACGVLYTAGRYSLAYLGLGDIFSFVFFGIVATAGTYFVQVGEWNLESILLGCAPGFYSVVLLAINNLRDRKGDERAGKKTLAVRLGEKFARGEVVLGMLAPVIVPWCVGVLPMWEAAILSVIAIGVSLPVVVPILQGEEGRGLNRLLFRAGAANLGFGLVGGIFLFLQGR